MADIVALGELLIDFTPLASRSFFANPGGAPANVLAAATKQGHSASFIGMVGDDDFGHMLAQDLVDAGIDTDGLQFTQEASTTLAFVQLDEQGDRSFTFIRKPGADMLLEYDSIDTGLIDDARIFHFGSVSMTNEPSRTATLEAALYAKKQGLIVSYDPNLRPLLWDNLDEARAIIPQGFVHADILKISEEELEFLTGKTGLELGTDILLQNGLSLIFVTLGPNGCFYATPTCSGLLPTYNVKVVDTTGAGDAFMGGALSYILNSGKTLEELLEKQELEKLVDFANATGALATTKKGGIPSMPSKEEVENCIQAVSKKITNL